MSIEFQQVYDLASTLFDNWTNVSHSVVDGIVAKAFDTGVSFEGIAFLYEIVSCLPYVRVCENSECVCKSGGICMQTAYRRSVMCVIHEDLKYPDQVSAAVDCQLTILREAYNFSDLAIHAFRGLCMYPKIRAELKVLSCIRQGLYLSDGGDPFRSPYSQSPTSHIVWNCFLSLDKVETCSICLGETKCAAKCCNQAIHIMCMFKWMAGKLPSARTCPTCRMTWSIW